MKQYSQRGLSLIELMVSLALGLIITLGVMNIFISARSTYTLQNTAAAMQEDARYLLTRMSQEIRMVGMFGCLATVTDKSTSAAFTTAFNKPIVYSKDSTSTVLTLVTSDVGSASTSPTWTVLSDCISSSTAYTGKATAASGQIAFPVHQVVYTFKSSTNALYTGTGTAQQVLLSNVKDFSLMFGLAGSASDTAVTSYATTVANPALVRSIRISLTLADPTTNTNAALPDQVFSVVASIRNRLL
ncbi:PilW family protein [Pseudomonas typographi]|uniref:Prepilin-type N-terminal cleavage/methylation domain-containing protein n=1 Tax=Pseudomonas typographi TaxID=2715964 RepID=A0ABR7YXN4_9PSED|nr:prepilin-type N-terminal cleavage/methylation domain-containing protein [Pseudomonas typographi]MBD1551061.1 prepilin-type N-terminal cleavage/methylation domain-containing protein [Pseudomonas typographi]MBD1587974.1 prepilin-type N-terminal cleavage/methylation domain-containing protein [Pseudomonas typographi]MBD1597963.1 prepilin-type N-terminal cleavage/methylation domain-containing protein [Pseudomonas typographi]